jgi:RHS repeat-associated protein
VRPDGRPSFVEGIEYNARSQRTRIVRGNGTTTSYVYDAETFRLLHLADEEVAAFAAASRTRYELDDHLGSAVMEVDETGEVISYEEYLPFGATAVRAARHDRGLSPKRYRYTGKERDDETGLHYHGARYYAAWLGRWTSADPAGFVDGLNLFCYVSNSPIVLTDPDGRERNSSQEQNACDTDPNNPRNYGSFEEFAAGAVGPWTEEGLHKAWDETHPTPPEPPSDAEADSAGVDKDAEGEPKDGGRASPPLPSSPDAPPLALATAGVLVLPGALSGRGVPSGEPPKRDNRDDKHWWKEIKGSLRELQQAIKGASRKQVLRELLKEGFTEEQIAEITKALAEAAKLMGEKKPFFLP